MRLARGGVIALAILLIAALVAAGVAFQQRNVAISEQVTAQADRLRDIDVSLAAQLDLTAYRMRPIPDRYTALVTDASAVLSAAPLTGHTDGVVSVEFSPDGRTLASAGLDRTVRLWNVTDPANPVPLGQPLTGHTGTLNWVEFSPDGRTLASASDDQTVRLWTTNVDQAIQRICAITRNTLTRANWELYVSRDLSYNPPCP